MSKGVVEYGALYDKLFGKVPFTMPRRPTPESSRLMNMTFESFLVSNNLTALCPIAILVVSAQGYGKFDTTPAYYGLVSVSKSSLWRRSIAATGC